MRTLRNALLGLVLGLVAGTSFALDSGDIAQMVKNDVDDSVIINMVQNQKLDRPLSAQEVVMLSSSGASSSLLEYLTRPEVVSSAYVAPAPKTTYIETSPTVVTSEPSVVVSSPTVVTSTPTYVAPTTTYVNPNYIYPNYYSVPTYVYPYTYYPRYRSGPSYSFGFSFGGGGRRHWDRPRHGGGRRPHGGRRR